MATSLLTQSYWYGRDGGAHRATRGRLAYVVWRGRATNLHSICICAHDDCVSPLITNPHSLMHITSDVSVHPLFAPLTSHSIPLFAPFISLSLSRSLKAIRAVRTPNRS